MKYYKLHLIRHGLTAGNLDGRYIGSGTDLPLCDQGRTQLADLKRQLNVEDAGALHPMPPMLAKNFRVEVEVDGTWNPVAAVTDNHHRLVRLSWEPVRCSAVRLVPDRSFRGTIVELHARPCDEHMRSIDTFHRSVVDPCPDFAVIMKLDPVIAFKQTLPCLARRIFRIAVIDKNQIVEIVHVVNPCCMGENVIRESGKSKVFRGDFSRKRA